MGLLLCGTPSVQAQSFLKKVGKAIDKAGNAVDKAVDDLLGTGSEEPNQKQQETSTPVQEQKQQAQVQAATTKSTPEVAQEKVETGTYSFHFSSMSEDELKSYFAANYIDDATRQELKIDQIVYKRLSVGDSETEDNNVYTHKLLREASNQYISKGPLFKRTNRGTIRRVYIGVSSVNGMDVYGFLVSYDADGNYIDSKYVDGRYTLEAFSRYDGNKIHVEHRTGGESWTETYVPQADLTLRKTDYSGNPL